MEELSKVKALLEQTLPRHEITYCEEEEQTILGLKFKNAGVAVKLESGLEFFGASSSQTGSVLVYAAYECLERFTILTQERIPSFESNSFRYALSNGVALHQTFEKASKNAYLELLERNEILKSWYYNTPIKHLSSDSVNFGEEINQKYEILVVDFSNTPQAHVIGIFALPKSEEVNLIYGFGCAVNLSEAINKAQKEFITRLGFLWDQAPDEEYSNKNSSSYHQEFYLRKENLPYIKEWLYEGEVPKKEIDGLQLKGVDYVNITGKTLDNLYFVIKATSSDSIPLFFGLPPKHIFDFPFRNEIPHPIV